MHADLDSGAQDAAAGQCGGPILNLREGRRIADSCVGSGSVRRSGAQHVDQIIVAIIKSRLFREKDLYGRARSGAARPNSVRLHAAPFAGE
jgi:hypothetical protein